ncbi:unnamed protein product, partial [Amoebophrya sp. A25]
AQESYVRRCRDAIRRLVQDFSEDGEVGLPQRNWRDCEGGGRKQELESRYLVPAYSKSITAFASFIEYCPSVEILVREILQHVPQAAMWLWEDSGTSGGGQGTRGGDRRRGGARGRGGPAAAAAAARADHLGGVGDLHLPIPGIGGADIAYLEDEPGLLGPRCFLTASAGAFDSRWFTKPGRRRAEAGPSRGDLSSGS